MKAEDLTQGPSAESHDKLADICTLSTPQHGLIMVSAFINGHSINCLVDSGAEVSVLPSSCLQHCKLKIDKSLAQQPVQVDGSILRCDGLVSTHVTVGPTILYHQPFYVVPIEYGILGLDALSQLNAQIDLKSRTLIIDSQTMPSIPFEHSVNKYPSIQLIRYSTIRSPERTSIPPGQEYTIWGVTDRPITSDPQWLGVSELDSHFAQQKGLLGCGVMSQGNQNRIPVRVLNITDTPIQLYKNQRIGSIIEAEKLEKLDSPEISNQSHKPVPFDPVLEVTIGNSLTPEQRARLEDFLRANSDIFAHPGNEGRTDTIEHHIPLVDDTPVTSPPRRIPIGMKSEVNEAIRKMENQGLIRPSNSAYSANICPVRKKDGSVRICIDYRALNKKTKGDSFPTGNLNEVIESMTGAKYFSVLDLAQGYYQIPIIEQDKEKTAFRSPNGLWEFNVASQGLSGVPYTFTRLMQMAFGHIPPEKLALYMDDLCSLAFTFEQFLERLQEIFQVLRKHGLRINAKKCQFAMEQVSFCGHHISAKGIEPDSAKVDAITRIKTISNVKDLKTFLGTTSWFRKFIPRYSTIAKPLIRLTEKEQPFTWNAECQEAFELLKQKLSTAPILRHPRPTEPFTLTTDASNVGIGAELAQMHDGCLHPVAYFSQTLSKSERNYSVYDKELLGIVKATQHFRHYLLGNHFFLRTDQLPLKQLRAGKQIKDPWGKRARWMIHLEDYNFTVEHISGSLNYVADALSRLGMNVDIPNLDTPQNTLSIHSLNTTVWSTKQFKESQEQDNIIAWAKNLTRLRKKPPLNAPRNLKTLCCQNLQINKDDILVRISKLGNQQIIAPDRLVPQILYDVHDHPSAGHQALKKTLERLHRFWWPTIRRDTIRYLRSCTQCAERKPPQATQAPMQERRKAFKPFELVETDIKGPLTKSSEGFEYVLVFQDSFSRFAELHPIRRQTSETVKNKLSQWIGRYGIPTRVHSDRGTCYTGTVFEEFCQENSIKHSLSSTDHPQANGEVERLNQSLGDMLAKTVKKTQRDWPSLLPSIQLAHNSSQHEGIGEIPYKVIFGQLPKCPIDMKADQVSPQTTSDETETEPKEYAAQRSASSQTMNAKVMANSEKTVQSRLKRHNEALQHQSYGVGTKVYLHWRRVPRGKCKALSPRWKGPFVVVKSVSPVNYVIRKVGGRKEFIVHHNRLKLYHEREERLKNPDQSTGSSQSSTELESSNSGIDDSNSQEGKQRFSSNSDSEDGDEEEILLGQRNEDNRPQRQRNMPSYLKAYELN